MISTDVYVYNSSSLSCSLIHAPFIVVWSVTALGSYDLSLAAQTGLFGGAKVCFVSSSVCEKVKIASLERLSKR